MRNTLTKIPCSFITRYKFTGLDYYDKHKAAWVLAKWNIEIIHLPIHLPLFNQKITIKTEPYSFRNFFGFRHFEILNDKNIPLAKDQHQFSRHKIGNEKNDTSLITFCWGEI